MSADIRKIAVWVEETHREAGREITPATRKAVAVVDGKMVEAMHVEAARKLLKRVAVIAKREGK